MGQVSTKMGGHLRVYHLRI